MQRVICTLILYTIEYVISNSTLFKSNCQTLTCAAVEGQFSRGVKLLDAELRERNPLIGVQRLVAFLPVEHQIIICVRI